METMDDLLKDFSKVKPGEIITGTVVSIPDDKTAYVDIQDFTEGTLHLDHFTRDKNVTSLKDVLKVGQSIKVKVTSVKEETVYLSCLDIIDDKVIEEIRTAFIECTPIQVTVSSEVKGKGYVATYKGLRVFLPKSQATASVALNKTIEVKITAFEEKGEKTNVIVSRREIENEEYKENREKEIEGINVGDVLKGTIAKIEKYGAVVKFNYATGLLLLNQISHKFIDINKELEVGQEVEVKVIKKENGKLELSKKALVDSPFEAYVKSHKVADKVTGKLVNKLPYGLLLELAEDVTGLLHSTEYSHNPNDNYANFVKIGDMIDVAIIKIDEAKERISLSRKALMDNPWDKVEAKVGDVTKVKITEINEKGLKVEAFGVDGYIPASEATKDKADLNSLFAVGDEYDAVVLEIRPKEWRLKLSIKKIQVAKEREEFEKYMTSDESSVTVGDTLSDDLKK